MGVCSLYDDAEWSLETSTDTETWCISLNIVKCEYCCEKKKKILLKIQMKYNSTSKWLTNEQTQTHLKCVKFIRNSIRQKIKNNISNQKFAFCSAKIFKVWKKFILSSFCVCVCEFYNKFNIETRTGTKKFFSCYLLLFHFCFCLVAITLKSKRKIFRKCWFIFCLRVILLV